MNFAPAIAYPFLFLSLAAIVYYSFAIYAATQFFQSNAAPADHTADHADPATEAFCPAVTILKPVSGADSQSYANFASFCQQTYPVYQIIFGVQDQADASIPVIQQLIQDFPHLDIQYVVSDRIIGPNLKVNNLANALALAQHGILFLADSDIIVGPDYLQRVVAPLHDPAVGVVTCLYRSLAQRRIAAFEALSLATEFLPSVLVARQLEGMTFALGATIALRRSVLDAIGGFAAVADYLGDDFQLGNLPALAGYRVVLSDYIVDHVMATSTWAEFFQHQTRWARGNRFSRPNGYRGLIFTYGTVSSLLFWALTQASPWGWLVLGVTWMLRYAMAGLIGVIYLQDSVAQTGLWLVPLRDFVSFAVWGYSFLGDTIAWRDRQLRLLPGGKLIQLPKS